MTEAVVLSISQMIDLAIGTPEVGTVDFNMLQTVLHLLAQQLHVLYKNVELRPGAITLPVPQGKDVQTIAITEYIVDNDKAEKVEAPPQPIEDNTILVVERVRKSDSSPVRGGVPGTNIKLEGQITTPSDQTPKPVSSTDKLSLVTVSKFNMLESVVEDLKNRVYGSMPKNEDILEEVRSQTNLNAITSMWTSLNVSSRLEAAEAGISKLSSLVQDLISQTSDPAKNQDIVAEETAIAEPLGPPPEPAVPQADGVDGRATKDDLALIQAQLNRVQADVEQLTQALNANLEDSGIAQLQPSAVSGLPAQSTTSTMATATGAQSDTGDRRQQQSTKRNSLITSNLVERVTEMEKRLNKCCEQINKNDGVVSDQLNSFQDQLEHLMKQVAGLTDTFSSGSLSPDLIKDLQGLMQLFQTVNEMQEQLKNVHETALQLAAEKEDRQHYTNALLEQIEFLKVVKMDKEDMVEAMAEKADLRMLARKVSHDQFEIACDDLSRGLDHALGKLNMQEALWQQALDDIQREIESKLDKIELSPVKDFFNNKLKQLQENLKQMALLRREVEAAGTKKQLLRDVNCISCDANAVMAMESSGAVQAKPLPPTMSMKPYLSYELDAIRKAHASNLPQRNMHDWENIDKQMSQPKPPQKVRSDTNKHLCNRYCGGSHTVTTPVQRVARLGHFIKQWGPDVLPLTSGLATGDDGRLYRISPTEAANVGPGGAVDDTCTPKSPTKKSKEESKPPQKPITISAECRCLEAADNNKPTK